MTDSLTQPDSEPGGGFNASELQKRLSGRATEPLGVIDVTYAQRKYLRLLHWVASRTVLLDRVRTLYGVEESLITGHPLALQDQFGQHVDVFSTTVQSFSTAPVAQASSQNPHQQNIVTEPPSSLEELLVQRSTTQDAKPAASPEGRFRITRRPPAKLSRSDTDPGVHHPRATADRVSTPSEESRSDRSPVNSESSDDGVVTTVQAPQRAPNMSDAPVTDQKSPARVSRPIVAKSAGEETREVVRNTRLEQTPAGAGTINPRGQARSSNERLSGREVLSVHSSNSKASPLPLVRPLADSTGNVTQEMVWRKQVKGPGGQVTTPDLRAEPASFTGTKASLGSGSQQEGRNGALESVRPATSEIKAEHISPQVIRSITERVMRAITLDLKVESERRGVTKWR